MSIEPGPNDQAAPDVPETPAPTYVTAEQFMAFQTQQTQTLQSMAESLASLRSQNIAPQAAPAERGISVEEYTIAVQTGDAATIDRYFDQKQRRYHATEVAPMQRDGAQILGDLQARTAAATLPHYARFRKEIDETFAQMPAQLRATPEAIKIAHDLVRGRHTDELLAEAREAALRAPSVQPNAPGAANSRAVRTDAVPSAEEWLGKDTSRALGGMSEDEFARRLGYKDWASYHKMGMEQVAAGEAR